MAHMAIWRGMVCVWSGSLAHTVWQGVRVGEGREWGGEYGPYGAAGVCVLGGWRGRGPHVGMMNVGIVNARRVGREGL